MMAGLHKSLPHIIIGLLGITGVVLVIVIVPWLCTCASQPPQSFLRSAWFSHWVETVSQFCLNRLPLPFYYRHDFHAFPLL